MKILAIPNWNGHLYLQEKDDNSVVKIYNKVKYDNKLLVSVKKNDIQSTNQEISNVFLREFQKEKFILTIAGDHSNSYPIVKTLSKIKKDFSLVIFDAHPDVEIDNSLPSHEDYLRCLIEKNYVKKENIYLFGIRTFSRVELEYLEENKIKYFTITDILKDKELIKKILKKIQNDIYLSVDIDVLDPDHAPGTYYKEYCGLYIDELIEFIEVIKEKIISCDIVEYYSDLDDKNKTTQKNVLKLINTFIK